MTKSEYLFKKKTTLCTPSVPSHPTCNKNPTEISNMSTGHQMLTCAICTRQLRTKIFTNPTQRLRKGQQEESWSFGMLLTVLETHFEMSMQTRCESVARGCVVWIKCGPAFTWGSEHSSWLRAVEFDRTTAVRRTGSDSRLAMYTFAVGPLLPHTSVISSGRVRKPVKEEATQSHVETYTKTIPHLPACTLNPTLGCKYIYRTALRVWQWETNLNRETYILLIWYFSLKHFFLESKFTAAPAAHVWPQLLFWLLLPVAFHFYKHFTLVSEYTGTTQWSTSVQYFLLLLNENTFDCP